MAATTLPKGHKVEVKPANGVKRKQDQADIQDRPPRLAKAVKRRASKACQCCRSRKVRCNVVEQIPCTNCRLDQVECIVSESKRKNRKWDKNSGHDDHVDSHVESPTYDAFDLDNPDATIISDHASTEHRPHALYNDLNPDGVLHHRTMSTASRPSLFMHNTNMSTTQSIHPRQLSPPLPLRQLPSYIKPLPPRIGADEVYYLSKKGALTIPPTPLRDALLRCFVEFVHPFMPLLDLSDLVKGIDGVPGHGQISLLLFQAIMFSGVAMVDMQYLRAAGYVTRREARRDFFQKTRLMYDFDYEADRISLIQTLLLMTYWYETPDDQKDSHHWMGIAVSLSHTIGLHRNPERSNMMAEKQRKLWKRIWWSTYMRDRLIALGMRRPTRIKNEDFDVPQLSLDDFSIEDRPRSTQSCISPGCSVYHDAEKQRQLAIMCLEKAKLCVCISHVLSTQYSVLHNNLGVQSKEGSTRTTMMLVAKKDDPETCGVRSCDEELRKWKAMINEEVDVSDPKNQPFNPGDDSIFLNRSLLHMVYYATLSALHRPQVLPSGAWPVEDTAAELLDMSRVNVRLAANQITIFAERLARHNLVRFLPTVGITVLLPAIIIHLLDIKAPDELTRRTSLQGFCQCMQIMSQLRDIYAAADYSTAFLEAAIRKAEISLPQKPVTTSTIVNPHILTNTLPKDTTPTTNLDPALLNTSLGPQHTHLTPPPDVGSVFDHIASSTTKRLSDAEVASRLNTFLADTPPDSHHSGPSEHDEHDTHLHALENHAPGTGTTTPGGGFGLVRGFDAALLPTGDHGTGTAIGGQGAFDMAMADFEPDFGALVNLDAAGEAFAVDDKDFVAHMPGTEGGEVGFMSSGVDWLRGLDGE